MTEPRPMPRFAFRYTLLAVLLFCACWVRGSGASNMLRILRNPGGTPDTPVPVIVATRTIGGGSLRLDQILAIDGHPFSSYRQYEKAVYSRHPGDKIRLTLSRPDGSAVEEMVAIPDQSWNFNSFGETAVNLGTELLVPLIALSLGAFAAAVRPGDRNAWLLLLLMLSVAEMASRDLGWVGGFALVWRQFWSSLWAPFMLLFGIYFPDRSAFERRHSWVKYIVLVPYVVLALASLAILVSWNYNIDTAAPFRAWYMRLYFTLLILGMVSISLYFVSIGMKSGIDPSADAKRRLRILLWGSSVSLTPMFLLALYSIFAVSDLFVGVPWIAVIIAALFLVLFPVTLAYVIVVERAMDLRFVVRQSLQYGLVKGGLWAARAVLVSVAVYLFSTAGASGNRGLLKPIELTSVGVGLLVLRKRGARRASQWIDQRFFREAYDAEKVLSELANQVGRYVQIRPLLETVAVRVSNTLHTPDIVILLREGDAFVPRYCTRPGEPMNLAAGGNIAKTLRERNDALEIYFDKPPLWLRSLTAEELQTLDFMRTQLLLPLTANEQLTGIVSLGPKLSEAPYTETDIRLLRAIAWQMGLALENSRLAASLARETAAREIANRELEIAREVQERLFPQRLPSVPGLDCAGYCRPARGVGGDYYDFLQLDNGRLGIAIGDVSGKGIAAALLMASLQASLRGQAAAGVHDLAQLMHNVNKLVYEASTSSRYATFFYGEYDPVTRHFSFVNAGHNPPLILRGEQVLRLEADGPVVGLLAGARYGQSECCLRPGDIFVAFTDGISEALNDLEEEWEENRFIPAAQACRELSAKEMIRSIFREVDAFTGAAKQYDDMTLLVMKLA